MIARWTSVIHGDLTEYDWWLLPVFTFHYDEPIWSEILHIIIDATNFILARWSFVFYVVETDSSSLSLKPWPAEAASTKPLMK